MKFVVFVTFFLIPFSGSFAAETIIKCKLPPDDKGFMKLIFYKYKKKLLGSKIYIRKDKAWKEWCGSDGHHFNKNGHDKITEKEKENGVRATLIKDKKNALCCISNKKCLEDDFIYIDFKAPIRHDKFYDWIECEKKR